MADSEVPDEWYEQQKDELPTVAEVIEDRRKGGLKLTSIAYSAFQPDDELVRRSDVLDLIDDRIDRVSNRQEKARENGRDVREAAESAAKRELEVLRSEIASVEKKKC